MNQVLGGQQPEGAVADQSSSEYVYPAVEEVPVRPVSSSEGTRSSDSGMWHTKRAACDAWGGRKQKLCSSDRDIIRYVPSSSRSKEPNQRYRKKPRVMLSKEFAQETGRAAYVV